MYISVQDKSTNSGLGLLSCPEYTQLRCYFMAAYLDKFDKLKFKKIVQLLSNYLALILAMVLATSSHLLAVPLSVMALPDWAYAERQRLSPILLRGEVMEVSCHEVQCTLKMKILQVLRNQSQRNIAHGDSLLINFVGKVPECHSISQSPPPIGSTIMSVRIPNVGDQTDAWLRPADGDSNTYDLTSGEYGFGPNLESIE